jgi:hypothetical protein
VEPRLQPDERELLHHLYPNGDFCLHKLDEWAPSMLLVDTVIPWTAEWLAHYELWKLNHQWYGDGDGAEAHPLVSSHKPIANPGAIGGNAHGGSQERTDPRLNL